MEFNYEGKNGGNNGGIMMYNYGLDHRELCVQFLVLTITECVSNCLVNNNDTCDVGGVICSCEDSPRASLILTLTSH